MVARAQRRSKAAGEGGGTVSALEAMECSEGGGLAVEGRLFGSAVTRLMEAELGRDSITSSVRGGCSGSGSTVSASEEA